MDFTHLVFTIDDSCKIQTTWALIPGTELARISHQVAGCYRIWMFGLKSERYIEFVIRSVILYTETGIGEVR